MPRRQGRMAAEAANLEDDLSLLREPLEQLAERSTRLHEIYEWEANRRMFGLPLKDANEDSSFEKKLSGLEELVQARVETSGAYFRFFLTFFFFLTYCGVLWMQRDIDKMWAIETSLLSQLLSNLPTTGMNGYFNEGRSATGFVTSIDEFYAWLNSSVIDKIFIDPVCGDGICDEPDEYPGFGRFGCEKDCGRYNKTTTLKVDLTSLAFSSPGNWDVSNIPYPQHPKFMYNIYSHTLRDFLWKEDQNATSTKIDVPDGKFTLHLYQGNKLADSAEIGASSDLRMNEAEFPVYNDSASRFKYGDPAEILMFSRSFIRGLEEACWETEHKITRAPAGCDSFDWWDYYMRALGGYGLAGSISVSAGRTALNSEQLANVPFCGVLPDGIEGFDNPSNRQQMLQAAVECSSARPDAVPLAPGTKPSSTSVREGVCISHQNCSSGHFCANWPHKTGGGRSATRSRGWAGLGAGVCQPCNLCRVDAEDAWSNAASGGWCPRNQCADSGGLPACVSAAKLLRNLKCSDTYSFEVWKHHTKGANVVVKPMAANSVPVRNLVPHGRMVTAVVVTQERDARTNCVSLEEDEQGMIGIFGWKSKNPSLKNFTLLAEDRVKCRANNQIDSLPMGNDPVFIWSSSLYNGKLVADDYYGLHERSNSSKTRFPYLFYPHQYDQITKAPKEEEFIVDSQRNKFKVYFGERLTQEQAQKMVSALVEGNFFESGATKKISVEVVTYNADNNIFCRAEIWFNWDTTGFAYWDFNMQSFAVDLYSDRNARYLDSTVRMLLEFCCCAMLLTNVSAEIYEIWCETRVFRLKEYATNIFNFIDWCSFIFQLVAWFSWFDCVRVAQQFQMKPSYAVLHNPSSQARFFATSAQEEHDFLRLLEQLSELGRVFQLNSTMSGMAITFMIFRLLKSLDFQPRMGLVTRTIAEAATDLVHFSLLFGIVFMGYAFVGTLVFGHQFEGMKNLTESSMTLFIILMSLDTTKFWTEMSHSAGIGMDWVFYLYVMTYLVIAFFILLNVFLAILIDSYAAVKSHSESAQGIFSELYDVLDHYIKKRLMSKSNFMSDERVLAALLKTRQGFLNKDRTGSALELQAKAVLGGRTAVLLHGGYELDSEDLARLVNTSLEGHKEEFYDEEDEAMYYAMISRHNAVVDMMERYGEDVQERMEQQNGDVMHLLRIEEMRRHLATYRAMSSILAQQKYIMKSVEAVAKATCTPDLLASLNQVLHAADKVRLHADDADGGEIRKLTVEVAEAKNLPKMDLLGKCDPYCVLIINGTGKQNVYSTTIMQKSSNPTWGETFSWMISSNTDKVLTITVMDKDTFKNDDLVGCVYVNLLDLPLDKEVNQWWPIENPSFKRGLDDCKLRLSITIRTMKQRQAGGHARWDEAKKQGLLPSRAPSSKANLFAGMQMRELPEGVPEEEGESVLQAGWGIKDSGAPRHGFFPGSSGIGWGVGLASYGNKVVPTGESAPQQVDNVMTDHLEDVPSTLAVHEPRRPDKDPPHKVFRRAPSAMS